MSDYDFGVLNDKEFEQLSADLLARHLGARVERFKSGRDSGVDGRFFTKEGNEVVIQCKHWRKSGISALKRELRNSEAEKVKVLDPERYIFTTSLNLSRADKKHIRDIMSPYIKMDSDVFGGEDINDLLKEHPDIERNHYKLWICSATVLQTILNSAIVGRSRSKVEEITENSRRYVITDNHQRATELLRRLRSVIITGAPGVGKTTLADQLVQTHIAEGFDLCLIEDSISEAESVYSETSKQVFYFDDFLGRNFLSALELHQDSHVLNFMKRVQRDPKKAFVLTSRSNILNRGKRLSDLYDIEGLDRNEYELRISSYSDIDKAKILYNHIWFSQLSDQFIEELYIDKRYRKIVKHENFNPRLIAFITDDQRLSHIRSERYWAYIKETLDNPKDVWRTVFEVQIDDLCRHIVVALALHGRAIDESELKQTYSRVLSSALPTSEHHTFNSVLRLLSGALVNRNISSNGRITLDLFDPSIADFVFGNYLDDYSYVDQLLSCLRAPLAISNLSALVSSGQVQDDLLAFCIDSQLVKASTSEGPEGLDSYKLRLLSGATRIPDRLSPDGWQYVKELAPKALSCNQRIFDQELLAIVRWAIEAALISGDDHQLISVLEEWSAKDDLQSKEFCELAKILLATNKEHSSISNILLDNFVEYLSNCITEEVIEEDVYGDIFSLTEYDEDRVIDYIERRLEELGVSFKEGDVEVVLEHFDIEDVIYSNIESATNDGSSLGSARVQSSNIDSSKDAIDDLFDRS